MLEITNLSVNYGAIRALTNISLDVKTGEIVALIGSNGAGKTTTLNTISGIVPVAEGSISFKGRNITKTPPHQIAALGIAHVPEGRRVFPRMSVMENLEMGAFTRNDREGVRASFEEVFQRFPRLEERKNQLAATLSGGEQQMLAMGRALMAKPTLMLMDEPSMGLAPMLVEEIFNIIRAINQSGTTILLVEQNAHMALSIASRAFVLETGNIVLAGAASELAANPEVRRAYLGE
ncbi:amino acid/amide ABC transporter ATP-binding protein 2 (HAAT family) [Hydrogenispora ethanolica]|uniref:Amino acid/amide ABC transporter ATP-binding protein 2 (HAAT family) n=1 Tax=Hydrogenispora ethanolica TaxID=1082276 RepID=A0A4R1RB67_HYDET|nr:ABC transporter ATP-binding protein [Hydrogenispora ethanolica]TCL62978.1 amino acid/amide ABC transporter ATP-binding protein 2 (HAAT family) [Hydrogenispora ethanolica]